MKTEKTFLAIFIIGMTLKLLHIPGGNIIVLLSLTLMALIYLLFSFYFLRDENKNQKIGLSVGAGIVFFIILIGLQFKLLYWPGEKAMMMSCAFPAVILWGVVFYQKNKATENLKGYLNKLFLRSSFLTGLLILLTIIPSSVLINIEYRSDPEFAKLKINVLEDSTNKEAQEKLLDYIDKHGLKFF